MRNTTLREFMDGLASAINGAVSNGVEPLALMLGLDTYRNQLQILATEAERKEREAKEQAAIEE